MGQGILGYSMQGYLGEVAGTKADMNQEVPECSALGLIALASHLEVKWGRSGMFWSALCLCHFGMMTGAILSTN